MEPIRPIWRPRIVERIERALLQRVAVLAAPAGFGKTVAIGQVTERLGEPVLYVTLPPGRPDPARVARAFADALARTPGADSLLLDVLSERDPSPAALAAAITRSIAAATDLVSLDGLTRSVMHDGRIPELIETLVAGSEVRWLIGTRSAATLPIASWMAYETSGAPVSTSELAFTEAEARQVAQALGLDAATAATALAWTHGWPTAFVLALRDPSTTPGRGIVADYLVEHVLDQLDEADRDLLMRLSPLPVIDLQHEEVFEPLAPDLVADAMRRLAPLVEQIGERAYRCHPLVRAFLMSRLRRRASGDYASAAARAARALLAAERYADALRVFVDAGDVDAMERLVSQHGRRLVECGETQVLAAAIRALADCDRADTPAILSLRATLASYGGDSRAAAALSERAIAAAGDPAEKLQLVHGFALELVKRSAPGSRETLGRIAPILAAACDELPAGAPARLEILGTLAIVRTILGDSQGARRAIAEKLAAAEASDDERLRATTYHQASYIAYIEGDAERSSRYAAVAARLATEAGLYPLAARSHSIQYAVAMELHDAYDRALAELTSMFDCAKRSDDRFLQIEALSGMLDIYGERGDEAGVVTMLARIEALDVGIDSQTTSLLPIKALFAAWQGDFRTAYELLAHSAAEQATALRQAVRWGEVALYAAVAGTREVALAALESATRAEQAAQIANRDDHQRAARALALRALAQLVLGNAASANTVLRDAERSRRTLSRRMQALVDAVRALYLSVEVESPDGRERAVAILRAADLGGLARLVEQLPFEQSAGGSPLAQLTPAEVEVLRTLARAGSNVKAAASLGRSVNTVNVHVKSILRKLRCASRHEALAIAREQGLVA
jgi:LuxR family maltose regulon positive regulatory protein